MRVAVTGATGHLGGAIVRELFARNFTIRALIRGKAKDFFDGIPVEFVTGDLENLMALKDLLRSCDALIHAAAQISIHGDPIGKVHKTNIEGTRNIMETARATGIKRVIHISTVHTFCQKPKMEILDESRRKVQDDSFAYDSSKREAERIALSYVSDNMDVLVMCPTAFIGPYDFKPSPVGQLIINLCKGKQPFIVKGGFDFCDVRDVASAIVNALTLGVSGETYLLSGKWYSLKAVADLVGSVVEKKMWIAVLPTILAWIGLPFIYLLGRLKKEEPLYTNEAIVAISDGNQFISSDKAKTQLEYTPRPLKETLGDTYRWFLKNGYLVLPLQPRM